MQFCARLRSILRYGCWVLGFQYWLWGCVCRNVPVVAKKDSVWGLATAFLPAKRISATSTLFISGLALLLILSGINGGILPSKLGGVLAMFGAIPGDVPVAVA